MYRSVMSLHGIRTRGVWQKDLVPVLARQGLVPWALDYGNFGAGKFLRKGARLKKVTWLRSEYERVTAEGKVNRPSIIAHSFGTYLVAALLIKYPELIFDKIILTGSIVDRDFDWPSLLSKGQINLVRNDYGSLDKVPRLATWVAGDTGDSGRLGFTKKHERLIEQKFPKHGHSDYFHRQHFVEYWIPTLMRVVVSAAERPRLTNLLDVAAQTAAARLGLAPAQVRANIFVPDENGVLHVPEGLSHNMTNPVELTVTVSPGQGATGTAFKERKQTIAILQQNWGAHTLPGTELAKVNKQLKWIVSTPIPDPDMAGAVLGIFNVDGLDIVKQGADLEPLSTDLLATAQALAVTFKELA